MAEHIPEEAKNFKLLGHDPSAAWGGGSIVEINKGYAYVGAVGGSSYNGPEGFTVHDVRDPRNPKKVAEVKAPPGVHCHKLRVVDGDTLDVVCDTGFHGFRTERLRLLGVNTPELKGATRAAGLAAKAFVEQWTHGSDYVDEWPEIVQTAKSDAFGRFLAWVWRISDGRCLNSDLLESGNAVPFEG